MKDKNKIWKHQTSSRGSYWLWRCEKCDNTNLEKFKICITCLNSKRPERTEENSWNVTVNSPDTDTRRILGARLRTWTNK